MAMLRSVKNVVHNYTEAEVKVREATSNDNWGPSTTLLAEIADLTQNQIAYSEVMAMLWKRLNDHGKNWRHVDKSLTVIDFLVKHGSDRVVNQCKENIFVIETLKNFQHMEKNGEDKGRSIRQKASDLVKLLKDEEIMKEERVKAKKTRQRLAESGHAVSSLNSFQPQPAGSRSLYSSSRPRNLARASDDMEAARPADANEEELQMQLALQMSREESQSKTVLQEKEDFKMEMALKQSLVEETEQNSKESEKKQETTLLDISDPWAGMQSSSATAPAAQQSSSQMPMDPFNLGMPMPANANNIPPPQVQQPPQMNDPWAVVGPSTSSNTVEMSNANINNPNVNVFTQALNQPTAPAVSFDQVSVGINPWATQTASNTTVNPQLPPNQSAFSQISSITGAATAQPTGMSLAPSQIDPWGNLTLETPGVSALGPSPLGDDPFGGLGGGDTHELKLVEKPRGRTPDLGKQFLGDAGADLVNLDTIVANPAKTVIPPNTSNMRSVSPNVFTQAPGYPSTTNPFASNVSKNTGSVFSGGMNNSNPFAATSVGPTLNQIKAEQNPDQLNQNTFSATQPIFPETTSGPNMQSNNNSNNNANPFF